MTFKVRRVVWLRMAVGLLRLTREHGFDDFLVLAMRHLETALDPDCAARNGASRSRRLSTAATKVAFWVPWQISW